jgi:hypothetical protein
VGRLLCGRWASFAPTAVRILGKEPHDRRHRPRCRRSAAHVHDLGTIRPVGGVPVRVCERWIVLGRQVLVGAVRSAVRKSVPTEEGQINCRDEYRTDKVRSNGTATEDEEQEDSHFTTQYSVRVPPMRLPSGTRGRTRASSQRDSWTCLKAPAGQRRDCAEESKREQESLW